IALLAQGVIHLPMGGEYTYLAFGYLFQMSAYLCSPALTKLSFNNPAPTLRNSLPGRHVGLFQGYIDVMVRAKEQGHFRQFTHDPERLDIGFEQPGSDHSISRKSQ